MTELTHQSIKTGSCDIHFVTSGTGQKEPLLLIHGWPQTWQTWNRLRPLLDEHLVITPDLRGLGDSGVTDDGYDKLSLAEDMAELYRSLDLPGGFIVGHDWGGVVAFYTAWLLKDQTKGLVVLDVTIPGSPGSVDIAQGGRRWHHGFNKSGVAEELVSACPDPYFRWFYQTLGARPDVMDEAAIQAYLESYRQPARVRAGLQLYHSTPIDEANAARVEPRGLPFPVLALGGDRSWGRGSEVLRSLSYFANDIQGGEVPECGHWIPEEKPDYLADQLRTFFEHCRRSASG